MRQYTIVIDAGHGGDDPGAVGWTNHSPGIPPRQEDDQNLAIAVEVAAELERRGHRAIMTRAVDRNLALCQRVDFINALRPPADLVISIHRDAGASDQAHGVSSLYNNIGDHPSPKGKRLAEILQKHLVARTGLASRGVCPRPAFRNGAQVESSLAILRDTYPPTVLVELGFVSNEHEELLGDSPDFRRVVAVAIGNAVDEYFA